MSAPAAHAATQTFSFTGDEQQFTVPAGVTSLQVEAIGATGSVGGVGARVSALIPVSANGPVRPEQTLYVLVGGNSSGAAGGFNGGGASAGTFGNGGGGASDIRTCTTVIQPLSLASACGTLTGDTEDPRLIVAAGGGGHSDLNQGGGGGNGGTPNGDPGAPGGSASGDDGGGGGGGTQTAGGTGGTGGIGGTDLFGNPAYGGAGADGGAGFGGTGGSRQASNGGGGGGGFFGGGGGGSGVVPGAPGGGGGGSSHVIAAATDTTYTVDTDRVPKVTISYTLANTAPSCAQVVATPTTILPATRDQFKTITLTGEQDAENDALSYHIDGVTQDELVTGTGVGDDTAPDARYYLTNPDINKVQVRAEASPKGDGRVYRIAYTVSDATGSCSAVAKVSVPRKKGQTAIDGPNSWNSFTGAPLPA